VLHSNRASVLNRLRCWELATEDGKAAVAAQANLSAGRCQLGVALLGSGYHQEAYAEFAKALQMEEDHKTARKGRSTVLKEMVLWKSASAKIRFDSRFWIDMKRPKGTSRVFALSDIFFQHRFNEDWVHSIDSMAFQDDVLIVAGNLADTKNAVSRALTTLKQKFRRVFYTVGNEELHIAHSEYARNPDSIAKLHAVFAVCDELGVDIFPAPICEGLVIVPLLSWYTAEFDLEDPFPDPNKHPDQQCKWPMDADLQVWKYMMKLNEPWVKIPYHANIITFSHFLPRQGLPYDKNKKSMIKTVGCEMIDEQVRALNSKLHVFGHTKQKYAAMHQGVRYVQQPVGREDDFPKDWVRRMMMVYDGRNMCAQEWGLDGEPPTGWVKRILYMGFYVMPNLKEVDLRKVRNVVGKFASFQGVQATFGKLGSHEFGVKDLAEKCGFPELEQLTMGATHFLHVVADDIPSLKGFVTSQVFAKDWMESIKAHDQNRIIVACPLGVDLLFEKKPDALLMVYPLKLKSSVTEDSEDYAKIYKAMEAIQKLPGITGKIACNLMPLGHHNLNMKELQEKIGESVDHTGGMTHLFTIWVDCPASFKMLKASKTFGKFATAYEPSLNVRGKPNVMAFPVPLDITATASAPKKEKKKGPEPKQAAARRR